MKRKLIHAAVFLALLAGCQWLKWKEFTSPEGRFSVRMPGAPTDQAQKIKSPVGTIDLHVFVLEHNGAQYMIAYNDYPEAMARAGDPEKVLDGARNGAVANVRGKLVREDKITLQQFPGRDLTVRIPEGARMLQTRLYFVKNRLYQVGVVTSEAGASSKDISKFFDSFKLLPN